MTLIIGKGSIEEKVKRERREASAIRRQEDVLKGIAKAEGPQRGDFSITKKYDKCMADYRRFKNPNDRKKITAEYYGLQKEYRKT